MFTLVNIISHLYHRIYGLLRQQRSKRRPKQYANHPFRRRPPRKPNRRSSPGRTYVNVCIWLPRLLMVLSAIQSPRRPTWTNRRVHNPKFFVLPGVDWCVTTVNSSLTCRRVPKALLPFLCPTKPPISELSNPCMASVQASDHVPHQIKFDMDSQKFLIDSGASAHIWNCHKDFISYHVLSPQERRNDQVLGVSGEMVALQGIGSIRLHIEDDLNDIHTIHLHDVRYLPEAPINIFIPQVFSQQRQAEGDSNASCSISADSITLQWTGENGKQANKYVPLNKSNIGICFTSNLERSLLFAACLLTCFYQCLRLCSCGTKPQRSENHHFVMTSSWEPQCHHDIIMRTPRIMGKPKFSSSGGL